eukprot:IDg20184t1
MRRTPLLARQRWEATRRRYQTYMPNLYTTVLCSRKLKRRLLHTAPLFAPLRAAKGPCTPTLHSRYAAPYDTSVIAYRACVEKMRVAHPVYAPAGAPLQGDSEKGANLRRMSSVIWRLRGAASSKSHSRSSRSRDSYGVLGLSLSGEALRDTHAVTSVVTSARVVGARA